MVGKVKILKLNEAHSLVARLLGEDETRKQKQMKADYPVWDSPKFDTAFDRRRLRLLNAILVAAVRCGMKPWLHDKNAREAGIHVGKQPVCFVLEHVGAGRGQSVRSRRQRRERLRLRITSNPKLEGIPLAWEDAADDIVEHHREDILVSLIVAGELQYRHGEIWRHRLVDSKARAQKEEDRRLREKARQEQERHTRAEKARFECLLADGAAFKQAEEVRNYVEQVRCAASEGLEAPDADAWVTWALAQADRIDPLSSRRVFLPHGPADIDAPAENCRLDDMGKTKQESQ